MDNLSQNSKACEEKNHSGLQEAMTKILSMAKQKGATEAEVMSGIDSGFSVDVRLGDTEKVEFSHDKSIGVTVFIDKCKGSASTSDMSDSSLAMIVDKAIDIAKVSASDECFGLADKSLMAIDYPDLSLNHPWDLNTEQAIKLGQECEALAMQKDKRIVNSEGASVSSYQFTRGYANSNGFLGEVLSTRHSLSCILVAQDDKGMQRDYDYTTARRSEYLMSIDRLAMSAADKTLARLNARKIKTQQLPVLFSAQIASTLIGSFISAISGGNLYRKNSFLVDGLGLQVFPEFVQIHEQPHLLTALGSSPYDGDGLLTRNNQFIADGKLVNYVLGTYTARRLGMESTANSGGVNNLTVDDTGQDFKQLVSSMHKGIIVTELMGQGINITTGDYSRGAAGFWVENGEILYPIDEFTIAGNLQTMFKQISAIGTDIDTRKSTRCGSILIDNMMIAG